MNSVLKHLNTPYVALPLSLLVLVLAWASGGAEAVGFLLTGDYKTEVVSQEFQTNGVVSLNVTNYLGSVTIKRGSSPTTVVIHATKRAATQDLMNSFNVDIRQQGNAIAATTTGNLPGAVASALSNRRRVTYEIEVPVDTNVRVRTATVVSPITVAGVHGTIDVSSESSPIFVNGYNGAVTVRTWDSVVDVQGGQGTADIRRNVRVWPHDGSPPQA